LFAGIGPTGYLRLKSAQSHAARHKATAASGARIGAALPPVTPGLDRALRLESCADRLTGDPGAVLLRDVPDQSGIVTWMTARLKEP
jgi:hypothetical protein